MNSRRDSRESVRLWEYGDDDMEEEEDDEFFAEVQTEADLLVFSQWLQKAHDDAVSAERRKRRK